MKITGATDEDSAERVGRRRPSGLPLVGPAVNQEEGGEVEGIAGGGAPDVAPGEAVSLNEVNEQAQLASQFSANDEDAGLGEYILPDPSSEDVDLLDLLVDTLDGEFDPSIFI